MRMTDWESGSPEESRELGRILGEQLIPGDLIVYSGDLGAGKTTFSQGVARGLGVTSPVTSPTFTILQQYKGRIPVFHVDAYRLEDPEEIREIGLEEIFEAGGVTLVEWPERLEGMDLLPDDGLEVRITHRGQSRRNFLFTARGPRGGQLVDFLTRHLKELL